MKLVEKSYRQVNKLIHIITLVIILLFYKLSFTQNNSKYLYEINSIDEAKIFILYNPNIKAEIIEYKSGCDSCKYTMESLNAIRDSIQRFDSLNAKVLEFRENNYYKSSYIFLDGRELSLSQADSIRNLIISSYKNGIEFKTLFNQFDMSNRDNEIIDWINGDILQDEFENAIKIII